MAAASRYKDLLDYTVAYKTVWSAVGVVFALCVAGLIAWHEMKPPSEEEKARLQVKTAERLLQRAEGCARGDISEADKKRLEDGRAELEAANQSLAAKAHEQALSQATRAQSSLKQFVDDVCAARDVVAEFRRIQGEVKVKKVNSPRWVLARKGPLAVGDRIWATSGVAEVFYPASGEMQQLRPGTVIEIRQVLRQPDGSVGTETRLESGELGMESAPNSKSVINAPHATVDPKGDAVTVLSPEGATETQVKSGRGGAEVRSSSGETTTLLAHTLVAAGSTGKLTPPKPVLESPVPKDPSENRQFSAEAGVMDVTFKWDPVAGAQAYRFQISPNDLFVPVFNEGPLERTANTSIIVGNLKPNVYFWRVAAIDTDRVDGGWSELRRFSIRGGKAAAGTPPPVIEIGDKVSFGDRVIIPGKTGQYVTLEVYLNGHKYKDIPVDDSGAFQAMVRFSQDGKNVIEFVATDTYGQVTRKAVDAFYSVD